MRISYSSMRSYPLSFVLSGEYGWDAGRIYNQGVLGRLWAITIYSRTNSYSLSLEDSSTNAALSRSKCNGRSIR